MTPLIDTAAAAIVAATTTRTIERWVHDGRLTNHGTPRRYRISLDELLTVLDQPADVA